MCYQCTRSVPISIFPPRGEEASLTRLGSVAAPIWNDLSNKGLSPDWFRLESRGGLWVEECPSIYLRGVQRGTASLPGYHGMSLKRHFQLGVCRGAEPLCRVCEGDPHMNLYFFSFS